MIRNTEHTPPLLFLSPTPQNRSYTQLGTVHLIAGFVQGPKTEPMIGRNTVVF